MVDKTLPVASESEIVLEPDFWELHGKKVLLVTSIAALGIVGFGGWKFTASKARQKAAADLAVAQDAAQLRAVVGEHGSSVVSGDARLLLADKLKGEGKNEEALAAFQEFVDNNEDHPLAAVGLLGVAEMNAALGKYEEAASKYEQVQSKFGQSYAAPLAMVGRVKALMALGRNDEARKVAEDVKVQHANSIAARDAEQLLTFIPKAKAAIAPEVAKDAAATPAESAAPAAPAVPSTPAPAPAASPEAVVPAASPAASPQP